MDAKQLVNFGVQHAASCEVEWWTAALDTIAARREEACPRYQEYRNLLEGFLAVDERNPVGFALENLGDAEKWLLLVVIDEFLDQNIISHETFADWNKVWKRARALYTEGYNLIRQQSVVFDHDKLDQAWRRLRAAAS